MAISQSVAAQIPYLRRFSRALTGSAEGGDAYVMATLETIVADPAKLSVDPDPRVALFRLFLDVWTATPINGHVAEPSLYPESEAGARRNLEAISLKPRIAFLLNALEGLDTDEVARVLDVEPVEAVRLIAAANNEISDQIATDVLIIEDEPWIALDLRGIVEELGHRVVGVARTHQEAVAAVTKAKPGLILADIQLADGSSGLDAVNEILGSFSTPVIFVTAYPERFLTGAPPEPAFLIAKPFSVGTLKAVISQALFFDTRSRRKEPERQS
jgi:CheY-like chemotaxis protein/DNA-directed RNA polymerase specialized sigma24 family protein